MRKAFSLLPGEFHGAGQAEVCGVAKSQTQVKDFHFVFTLHWDQLCCQAWRRRKDATCQSWSPVRWRSVWDTAGGWLRPGLCQAFTQ